MDGELLHGLELDDVVETGVELGKGSFGVVLEVKVKGLRCAGKKLHNTLFSATLLSHQQAIKTRFIEECVRHANLRHPNIVQLIGIHTYPGEPVPMLVMECMHSTLSHYLEEYPNMPIHYKQRILLDVTLALRYLHERNDPIIHRDLTANNVLLTEDLCAKVSDLGMARIVPTETIRNLTVAPGTTGYMPPEALRANPIYNTKLDIFSLGILIMHVVLEEWPLPHMGANTVDPLNPGTLIPHSEVERRANHFQKMDPDSVLTVTSKQCLSNDPRSRPSAREVGDALRPLMLQHSSLFLPLSLFLREREEMERRKKTLEEHSEHVECQLHSILQSLQEKFTLNEPELDKVVRQLQVITHSTRSVLYNSGSNSDSSSTSFGSSHYDGSQPQLVVAYRTSPSLTEKTKTLLHVSSDSSMPHPLSLTISTPFNILFSGTYIKTVISGLSKPIGLAISGDMLYVVDNMGSMGVHKCNVNTLEREAIVESASRMDGLVTPLEKCWYPSGVAINGEGDVILTDTYSHRVTKFSAEGEFLASCGSSKPGSEQGEFNEPMKASVARNGDVYVCDRSNHRIQILDTNLLSKGVFGNQGSGECEFHHPWDVTFDSKGNIYVVDCSNCCVKVFSPGFGRFLRQIGKLGKGMADFQGPTSVCVDRNDLVYVADKMQRCVKVFTTDGDFVMRFGSVNHEKQEFRFEKPLGMTLDSQGRLYVSDAYYGHVLMYE